MLTGCCGGKGSGPLTTPRPQEEPESGERNIVFLTTLAIYHDLNSDPWILVVGGNVEHGGSNGSELISLDPANHQVPACLKNTLRSYPLSFWGAASARLTKGQDVDNSLVIIA